MGGGASTKTAIDALPKYSTIYIYGLLSPEDLIYDAKSLIFRGITIQSLYLGDWMDRQSVEEMESWIGMIMMDLSSSDSDSIFKTRFIKSYSLDEIEEALKASENVASEGKVLIKPHLKRI